MFAWMSPHRNVPVAHVVVVVESILRNKARVQHATQKQRLQETTGQEHSLKERKKTMIFPSILLTSWLLVSSSQPVDAVRKQDRRRLAHELFFSYQPVTTVTDDVSPSRCLCFLAVYPQKRNIFLFW